MVKTDLFRNIAIGEKRLQYRTGLKYNMGKSEFIAKNQGGA